MTALLDEVTQADRVTPVRTPDEVIAYVDQLVENHTLLTEGNVRRALVLAIRHAELAAALGSVVPGVVNGLPVDFAVLVLLRSRLPDACRIEGE